MEKIPELVRNAEKNYIQGVTTISKYVEWSMHDTIETIDAYLNSKHISGSKDSKGRDKAFLNICISSANIWYRATDIDRKSIKFKLTNTSDALLNFVANQKLQQWMEDSGFGLFLNKWGLELARYGSIVVKFVEKGDELISSVIPWNRFIPDPVDFDSLPGIEFFYLTPEQLRSDTSYDKKAVDMLLATEKKRATQDGQEKDARLGFIKVYEVHGNMDERLLQDNPRLDIPPEQIKYTQQMHVMSFVQTEDGYKDFTLFKGREHKSPYMITHLIEEDGRTLSKGAVEPLFDAQWMQNTVVKRMNDQLEFSSKVGLQTADKSFANKNMMHFDTGDMFIHEPGNPLQLVNNSPVNFGALVEFSQMWSNLEQNVSNTPDAMRGTVSHSATPYSLQALVTKEATSLFELMKQSKGMQLDNMIKKYVIPHIKKQLNTKKEIIAELDEAGVKELDALYLPVKAVHEYNQEVTKQMFANAKAVASGNIPNDITTDFEQPEPQGNKRVFVPDKMGNKMWKEILADFDWDSLHTDVANESTDTQTDMTTLVSLMQTLGANPAMLQDPNIKMLFTKILTTSGTVSPLEITQSTPQSQPQPQVPQGGG